MEWLVMEELTTNSSSSPSCGCNSTQAWCGGPANASIDYYLWSTDSKLVSCIGHYFKRIYSTHGKYDSVVYILTFAICSLLLMVSLICLSPFRQHSRNRILTAALWASQVLPYTVIAHTLTLMQSSPYPNHPYAIWAALCLLINGISSSRLYGLHDPRQQRMQVLKDGVVLYLAAWSMYLHHPEELVLLVPLLSILVAAALKFIFGFIEICLAYSPSHWFFGLRRRVKLVADFMSFEHESNDQPDPESMTGYRYLVKGEEKEEFMANEEEYLGKSETLDKTAVVTVERIWKCNGKLFQEGHRKDLKDKCLSFALFRLLVLRCREFRFHKKHYLKNWQLMQLQLLRNHERAFRVIEDELSFLYDYFYSQYPLLFSPGKFFAARTAIYTFLEFVQFLAGLCIIVALFMEVRVRFGDNAPGVLHDEELRRLCKKGNGILSGLVEFDCDNAPAVIHFLGACIFFIVYVILRILQVVAIAFSNWAKVWLLCEYVRRPSLQANTTWVSLIRFVCGCKRIPWKPWRRKLGQYSLLSSYNVTSVLSVLPKRGEKSQKSKQLEPSEIVAVLLERLRMMDNLPHQLTNGLSSLQENNVDSLLSWACKHNSIADTILVWHIATSLCTLAQKYGDLSNKAESWKPGEVAECEKESAARIKPKPEAAECLSGYCAYLVAFVPALLPEPTDAVEVVFDQAVKDARKLLQEFRGRLDDVYYELKELGKILNGKDEEAQTEMKASGRKPDRKQVRNRDPKLLKSYGEKVVVTRGAKLGVQLLLAMDNDSDRVWKVLVDFWVEMILFLAPSDNIQAHSESLANGGELITHLWALLTHVGGRRKDPADDENLDPATGAGGGFGPSSDKRRSEKGHD